MSFSSICNSDKGETPSPQKKRKVEEEENRKRGRGKDLEVEEGEEEDEGEGEDIEDDTSSEEEVLEEEEGEEESSDSEEEEEEEEEEERAMVPTTPSRRKIRAPIIKGGGSDLADMMQNVRVTTAKKKKQRKEEEESGPPSIPLSAPLLLYQWNDANSNERITIEALLFGPIQERKLSVTVLPCLRKVLVTSSLPQTWFSMRNFEENNDMIDRNVVFQYGARQSHMLQVRQAFASQETGDVHFQQEILLPFEVEDFNTEHHYNGTGFCLQKQRILRSVKKDVKKKKKKKGSRKETYDIMNVLVIQCVSKEKRRKGKKRETRSRFNKSRKAGNDSSSGSSESSSNSDSSESSDSGNDSSDSRPRRTPRRTPFRTTHKKRKESKISRNDSLAGESADMISYDDEEQADDMSLSFSGRNSFETANGMTPRYTTS